MWRRVPFRSGRRRRQRPPIRSRRCQSPRTPPRSRPASSASRRWRRRGSPRQTSRSMSSTAYSSPHVAEVTERRQPRRSIREHARDQPGSKRALLRRRTSPSRTISDHQSAADDCSADADSINCRQSSVADTDASRCRNAEPTVSAPIKTPSAAPRRRSNQPAAIFIPSGYTQASAAPVATCRTMRPTGPSAPTSAALAAAATRQPTANSRRGSMMSRQIQQRREQRADDETALHRPSSAMRWPPEYRRNSAMMGAFAAVAENHKVIPRNMARDSHAS